MKLSEKKTKFPVLKICLLAFIAFLLTSNHTVFAQQVLEGENYKIVAPSISSGGDFLTNEDGSLKMGTSVGDVFADPKLYSDLYMASARDSLFEPFIPDVACFETTTDGESTCTTGPEFLNENGMVRVCGPEGCYDRARFEIDANDNPEDTLYGIQISEDRFEDMKAGTFATNRQCGDNYTDPRDGQIYSTVQIGEQCWMAENLNYDNGCSSNIWQNETDVGWCGYHTSDVEQKNGLLYQWSAAMDDETEAGSQGICPNGWYVPTNDDLINLKAYVSSQPNYHCEGNSDYIAKALASKISWASSDVTCAIGNTPESNNATGFNAITSGWRSSNSTFYSFGSRFILWSSSKYGGSIWANQLKSDLATVSVNSHNPANSFSIRCILDDGTRNYYIDGVTHMPKTTKPNINDFKTKTNWESEVFNIKGLKPNTEYSIRITALFGDLTESAPSETKEATTAFGSMAFRIGLGYEDGENVNYNPPYEILFDESFKLIRGANVRNSDRLIWTLTNTNSVGGITIVQKGEYAGLYNEVEEYTLESITDDLDTVTEGIGLQNRVISQLYIPNEGGLLSSLVAKEEYNLGENNVGIIETLFKKIYESDGPIHTGRTALDIKAKASLTTPEGEYREDITFVLIAKY